MLDNDAPEKWLYTEHAKVKHELLQDYLPAWGRILATGGVFGKDLLVYVDGFAGRGQYEDEGGIITAGSPIIALEQVPEWLKYTRNIELHFVEENASNFGNLKSVVESRDTKDHRIDIHMWNREFVDALPQILSQTGSSTPAFYLIDPFGFGGVPFEAVKRILARPRSEVFFTLMVRDISRFLEAPNRETVLTSLFGTAAWQHIPKSGKDREIAIRDLYVEQLRSETKTKFIWTFRVCMDHRMQTVYYLVHATNHLRGIQLMKGVMHNQGTGIPGSFAFLGPQDFLSKNQLTLFNSVEDSEPLKQLLLDHFQSRNVTFEECQAETIWFDHNPCVEKHYRAALKELEAAGSVKIQRIQSKKSGVADKDVIHFPGCRCHWCSNN